MARVKCPRCGERMDKEGKTYIESRRRYYHPECIEEIRKENREGVKKPRDKSTTPENDYRELIAYICELYDRKAPGGQILQQVRKFKEDYGYKYKGMELALRFFHEIEENGVKDNTGVGIIPYVYDRAKDFYIRKKELEYAYEEEEEEEVRRFISRPRQPRRGRRTIDMDNL